MTAGAVGTLPPGLCIPTVIEEIDASWIADLLATCGLLGEARVARIERRVIGDQKGFLSATVRVAIHYDRPAPESPASLVVKIEPPAGGFRDAERDVDAFAREVRFYRDVAGHLPLRLPRVYFADARRDGSALVMKT